MDDTLNRKAKSMGSLAYLPVVKKPLAMDVQASANQFVRFDVSEPSQDKVQRSGAKEVVIGDDSVMRIRGRICVLNVDGLRDLILEEAHSSCYSIHPCVKYEYQKLGGLIQRLEIPEWKWERITMDFVVGLPRSLKKGSWDQFLPLAEFAYNNFQSSIQVASYEALYGRKYHSPVGCFEPGEARLLGTHLVRDAMEKVKVIQKRLRMVRSKQKNYVDRKVRDVAYMVGEKILLRVSPMKSVMRFGNKGKLSLRFIGPFEVLERI
ncbi:uncharacterized protein [Nicotiana tomentosiformis]|uniref:uncharacterized protein n=1 Tax=Nicotiana tomentosiformis TaxID=4098 RepID=UPI00388C94CE